MPPTSPKNSSVSLGELDTCQDFLDGHREYALDLLSSIEKLRRWHGTDSCPETRDGQTCSFCGLCNADGLLGATKQALASYDDAENRLQQARTLLGKSAHGRRSGVPARETLFRNESAKSAFLCIVTTGEGLRSQHATWRARLQSEVTRSSTSTSAQSHRHNKTRLGDVDDESWNGAILLPTYLGPKFAVPGTHLNRTAGSVDAISETTSNSSMFVVFRRRLSSHYPCEANRASASSYASSRSAFQRPPLVARHTRMSKGATKVETATQRGHGKPAAQTTTTTLEHHSGRTRDAHMLSGRGDALVPQEAMQLGEPPALSNPTPAEAELSSSSSPSPECDRSIVDPRIFHRCAQIARSDDVRRALMAWCQGLTAELKSDLLERRGTRLAPSPTHTAITKDMCKWPSAWTTRGLKRFGPLKLPCKTGRVEAFTNGLFCGDDETTAQEMRFSNSEQEALEVRWLIARRGRCKDQTRGSALVRVAQQ